MLVFIASGTLIAIYYLIGFVGGLSPLHTKDDVSELISRPSFVIGLRVAIIIISTVLFFSAAAYSSPAWLVYICIVWILIYTVNGIRSIYKPFPNQTSLYEWAEAPSCYLTSLATAGALIILICLSITTF